MHVALREFNGYKMIDPNTSNCSGIGIGDTVCIKAPTYAAGSFGHVRAWEGEGRWLVETRECLVTDDADIVLLSLETREFVRVKDRSDGACQKPQVRKQLPAVVSSR